MEVWRLILFLEGFCGTSLPGSIISSNNALYIKFVSDAVSDGGTGFLATYISSDRPYECDASASNECGVCQSPGYPSNYQDGTNCITVVTVAENNTIEATVVDLSIENCQNCCYDALEIFDGDSINSPRLANLCGVITNNPTYSSSSNEMTFRLRTDGSVTERGFQVTYVSRTPGGVEECGTVYVGP